jgi:F-type H+-transporting ATPase subunit delta
LSEAQVTRVYAKGLFAAADEAGSIDRVNTDLRSFVDALGESAALRNVLFDPQIDTAAKLRVVGGLTEGADKLLANTLKLLVQKGRVGALTGLADEYEQLVGARERTVRLEVTSAIELKPATAKALVARVLWATGRRVALSTRTDASILGGLVLRIDDVIIDGSLRSRFGQLRQRLLSAEVRGGE